MTEKRDLTLGTEKIPGLMLKLALPAVAAQLVNVLYNIVDRIYIGHIEGIGDVALTGLGVAMPMLVLISAFSAFTGSGGAPLASIQLGKGDREKAEKILGNGVFLLLFFGILVTAVCFFFKKPLLYLFGASDNTYPYADEYVSVYLFGTLFVMFAVGLNTFISAQGKAKIAMFSVLIGAVLNIGLDPLFIFVFKMNVAGAALATIISQAVSALWVVGFLVKKTTFLRIRISKIRPEGAVLKKIFGLGIAPFIMQATESAIVLVMNTGLRNYGGDAYVGALTVMQSVNQVFFMPLHGFSNGVQPIISYNFGAGKFDRVKKTFKILLAVSLTGSLLAFAVCSLFSGTIARIFTEKDELVSLVARMMPVFMAGMSIFGIQVACQSTFMGLGQAKTSLFIALLRKVILLIPLALLFPVFFGAEGIYAAEAVADFISATTAGLIFLFSYKKILTSGALAKIG